MSLLSIANKNFYILMFIVICILLFYELRECNRNTNMKRDKTLSKILITIYTTGSIIIFILSEVI